MNEKNFVHLHNHTEYSLLDGASRISDLIEQTKNLGMNALAITDHGTMYGVIDFYKAAIKNGVKPIIGCEVYVAPKSRFDRTSLNVKKNFHLILLAENNEGYKNLIKLVSCAATEGFYYKPRVDKELLRKYHGGLIALSACIEGEIPKAILQNNFPRAVELVKEYVEIFRRENFFLELQNHGLEDERIVREALIKISQDLNVNLVATNDCHYVRREDAEFQDLLLCIQTNTTVDEKNRLRFPSDDYYLKSPKEMRELFFDVPEACDNTLKIAERCNVTFEFGKLQLPKFPLPAPYKDELKYLRDLCYQKVHDRYLILNEEVISRLENELEIINQMGYAGYFLIVWDFIKYAKKKGIAVGPGRGSAAGSIVAYILEITELDPLQFNLLFERFLNPERVTMPDIDVDFCYIRREEVIDYVKKKYGEDHVAQIVTFGTMAAKAVVRDVVRALNIPYAEGSRIISMIPNELKITLDKALQTSHDLKNEYARNFTVRRVINFSKKLEGLPRHASTHAAGIVISKLPLTNYVPVQILKGSIITQYDKDRIEELGLLKMDFLGLRTLTIINETIERVRKIRGKNIDITKIPLDDQRTASMLSDGNTGAVFQMESEGMTKIVKELQPTCFSDLIPMVALYRPGPLGSGMVEDFIAGKHGKKMVEYFHPKLVPILKETFGVILYQEQVMQIVQVLAGFTLGQADLLRRAMSKKKAEILLAQKENFLNGCEKNGIEKSLAEKIFELLLNFADYGFNKSHSAAYALIAWQTAYLKANFPIEYMAAMLSSVMDSDKIATYVEVTKKMGIKILPPDVNLSGVYFEVEGYSIRYALSAIKNLGEIAISGVVKVREDGGKFNSLFDFCCRVNLRDFSIKSLDNLIKCGAFDSINPRRTALLEFSKFAFAEGAQRHKDAAQGQGGLFDRETISKTENKLPQIAERPRSEILAWEKEAFGFYMNGSPLNEFKELFSGLIKINEIKSRKFKNNQVVKIGGIIIEARQFTTKRGDLMAYITLEDFNDEIDITIFPALFNNFKNFNFIDKVVVVTGRIDTLGEYVKILADEIILAQDYIPDIYFTAPENLPEKIFNLLKKNNGESAVFFKIIGKWRKQKFKVSIDKNLYEELKKLIGTENFRIY